MFRPGQPVLRQDALYNFTVAHSESLPEARVHRGSHKHASHTTTTRLRRRSLHIHEFPNIISAILELNYFMVGGRVVRQARGAPMGSPASPALCSMVVAVHEQAWAITYRSYLYNTKHLQADTPQHHIARFFATRYVDNRLMVIPTWLITLPPFAELVHKDFYVPPVELEMEPGYGFLGMELDPDQHAIHYTRHIQMNDIPSPHSATASTVLHSGMRARLRQARSMCMPHSAIAMAEAALKGRSWQRDMTRAQSERHKTHASPPAAVCLADMIRDRELQPGSANLTVRTSGLSVRVSCSNSCSIL